MCMDKNSEPPPAIWNLQHLRFLDLSSTGIKSLTHFSADLYHLQSLYIRKCKFQNLPRDINKLKNLRHLCADKETIAQISGIGQLTNLQELGVFVVGKNEGHKITELRNLREIRGTLTIENFENIKSKDEAMLANLVDKRQLDSISIISIDPSPHSPVLSYDRFPVFFRREVSKSSTGSRQFLDKEVLEGLRPHKDIKYLNIHAYLGSYLPSWINHIGDFLNTLYLHSWVNVEVLPPLGQLPSLKHLRIENFLSVKLIDSCFYGTKQTVFPLLEELVLTTLTKCVEWKEARAREFFPRLSKLTITNSSSLEKAPLHSFSSSLTELTISNCQRYLGTFNILHLSSLTYLKLCNTGPRIEDYDESDEDYDELDEDYDELDDPITTITITERWNMYFDPLNIPLLQNLYLSDCPYLEMIGDLCSFTHLKRLQLVKCPNFFSRFILKDKKKGKRLQVHLDRGLQSLTYIKLDTKYCHLILGSLPSLRVLKLSKLTEFTNDQMLWFQELTALKEIHFSYCEFEHLPASLTLLSSLKKLVLKKCTELQSLSLVMPPCLRELLLWDCSQNLVQRCQPDEGEDWQFISSIPVIQIDGITIRKSQHSDVTE